ncbi:MAG: hypothetical protein FWE67_01120 [Planctomycetaceae bacterium]|nr:hypothetical protein [Planctomycetaceae bacterium]
MNLSPPLRTSAEERMFQKLILVLVLGIFVLSSTGCLVPMYSGDPKRRNKQLLYNSENLRLIHDEWERFWFLDQPSHLTPYRTHGGII